MMDDDLEMAPRAWKREVEEKEIRKSRAQHAHRCSQCKSVRWYPPLLTLSTIMSGVFCWLYVTKPMQVTQTIIEPSGPGSEAIAGSLGNPLADPGAPVSESAAMASFDPEQGGLPGESMASAVGESIIPGQESGPVVVTRFRPDLFRPMKSNEVEAVIAKMQDGAPESGDAIEGGPVASGPAEIVPEGEASPGPGIEEDSLEEEVIEAEDSTSPSPVEAEEAAEGGAAVEEAASEVGTPSPGEHVFQAAVGPLEKRVAVSLMGEFVSDYIEYEAALADSKKE